MPPGMAIDGRLALDPRLQEDVMLLWRHKCNTHDIARRLATHEAIVESALHLALDLQQRGRT